MPRIGVRELKTHASEVARDVHDNHARYAITNRGEPLALLVPYSAADAIEVAADAHEELRSLREHIARLQKKPFSAVELLHEQRR